MLSQRPYSSFHLHGCSRADVLTFLFLRVVTPVKQLVAFSKVFLSAGETKTVELNVSVADMALWNEKNKFEVETGEFIIWVRLSLSPLCLADIEAENTIFTLAGRRSVGQPSSQR